MFAPQSQQRFPVAPDSQNAGFPNTSPPGSFQPPRPTVPQQPLGVPPRPMFTNQQPTQGYNNVSNPSQGPGVPPPPQSVNQLPGISSTAVRPGFPPPPNSTLSNQQPRFSTQPTYSNQSKGMPPSAIQQPGFPPQPMANQQPGFPSTPQSMANQQQGFPPPPQSMANQQPGFPPTPQSMANQQPGFPPPPQSMANQQPGFPPTNQQPCFPPTNQQPGFPPTNQQPGFPPQTGGQQGQSGQSIQEFVNSKQRTNVGMNAMQTNFSNMAVQVYLCLCLAHLTCSYCDTVNPIIILCH